jgi:hypothetical protein
MISLHNSRMNRVMRASISISEACNKHASELALVMKHTRMAQQ